MEKKISEIKKYDPVLKAKFDKILEEYGYTEKAQSGAEELSKIFPKTSSKTYYEYIYIRFVRRFDLDELLGEFTSKEERNKSMILTDYLEVAYLIKFLKKVLNAGKNKEIPEITLSAQTTPYPEKPLIIKNYKLISSILDFLNHYLFKESDGLYLFQFDIYENHCECIKGTEYIKEESVFNDEELQMIIDYEENQRKYIEVLAKSRNAQLGQNIHLVQKRLAEIGFLKNKGIKGKDITNELAFLFDLLGLKKGFNTTEFIKEEKYRKTKDYLTAYYLAEKKLSE